MIDLVERSAVYQRLTNKTRMGNPKSPDDILTNLVNVTFVSWAFVSQVITKKNSSNSENSFIFTTEFMQLPPGDFVWPY